MNIIFSPAKKMKEDNDDLEIKGLPFFLDKSKIILDHLRSLSKEELQKAWNCNDKIAQLNYQRIMNMDLTKGLSPAIFSYEGLAYEYLAPGVFEDRMFSYIQKHLYILSAFYGAVRPFDGIVPYRLEMNTKVKINGYDDMYAFWGDDLYKKIRDDSGIIVNLASKEYSKCIEDYISKDDRFINIVFLQKDGSNKGTYAKMARGEMLRYMAEKEIEDPQELMKFDCLKYAYNHALSSDNNYVFCKEQ